MADTFMTSTADASRQVTLSELSALVRRLSLRAVGSHPPVSLPVRVHKSHALPFEKTDEHGQPTGEIVDCLLTHGKLLMSPQAYEQAREQLSEDERFCFPPPPKPNNTRAEQGGE